MTIIATHNGSHHADDVFGVAMLLLLNPTAHVQRTRDQEVLDKATYVVDVGGVWDPASNRFDHHQKGFTGKRANGTGYASAGLVWDAYGMELIKQRYPAIKESVAAEVFSRIDRDLMEHIDRADTGVVVAAPGLYGLTMVLDLFNATPTQLENTTDGSVSNAQRMAFMRALQVAHSVILQAIHHEVNRVNSFATVRAAQLIDEGRIMVLPQSGLNWVDVVCAEFPDVMFVVYPDSAGDSYQVRTVPVEPASFKARFDLPEAWGGLRHTDLADVTGVLDALFCHTGLFIGGAYSKEGAVAMARAAVAHVAEKDKVKGARSNRYEDACVDDWVITLEPLAVPRQMVRKAPDGTISLFEPAAFPSPLFKGYERLVPNASKVLVFTDKAEAEAAYAKVSSMYKAYSSQMQQLTAAWNQSLQSF